MHAVTAGALLRDWWICKVGAFAQRRRVSYVPRHCLGSQRAPSDARCSCHRRAAATTTLRSSKLASTRRSWPAGARSASCPSRCCDGRKRRVATKRLPAIRTARRARTDAPGVRARRGMQAVRKLAQLSTQLQAPAGQEGQQQQRKRGRPGGRARDHHTSPNQRTHHEAATSAVAACRPGGSHAAGGGGCRSRSRGGRCGG